MSLSDNIYLILIVISFIPAYQLFAEETSYSVENSRVLKLLAEADAKRKTSTSDPTKLGKPSYYGNISDTYYEDILNEVKQLKKIIYRMQQMNYMDELINKCIASIKRHNEYKVKQHWQHIQWKLNTKGTDEDNEILPSSSSSSSTTSTRKKDDDDEQTINEQLTILRRIVIGSYEGLRMNILPIIQFINHTKIINAFQPLLQEMRDYDHIYGGNEIFLIARLIRLYCGTNSRLYEELPYGIQYIDSYSVHLLNENNQGLLYYKVKTFCRGRHCSNHELYTFHQNIHDLDKEGDDKYKSEWIFEPSNTSEPISAVNIKFYMRNGFIPPPPISVNTNTTTNTTTGNVTDQAIDTPPMPLYANIGYEYRMSPIMKSVMIVSLVNHTEDAIRIRVEQSHLVRRLIMGNKDAGTGVTYGKLTIMGTEDRFESANDGNWVVLPIQKLSSKILQDRILWNKNVRCNI